MLILGIDPGTARLGYGVVLTNGHKPIKFVAAGCLETGKETPTGERLFFLSEEIGKVLAKYKPDVMAIEQLFFGINSRTAMAVGQARGVVMAMTAKHKVPIFEYQGLSVKFAVTGSGKSDKKQVQEAVRKKLRMKNIVKPDDAADGLAIAIAHHLKTLK
ncbi:crossover junction endodeoxyribonuclease RuvC [Candidatus Microgenomates bacterium]|nr:crossover junction endodeoxyribonuclease RuvC [Candidatus Microgenomates bacterium]